MENTALKKEQDFLLFINSGAGTFLFLDGGGEGGRKYKFRF